MLRSMSLPRDVAGLTDLVALLAVVFLIVAFAPALVFEAWTPRVAIAAAMLPLGSTVLFGQIRERDRSARLLVLALGWTIIAGMVSGAPRTALTGVVGRDMSAFVVVCCGSLWAVGRQTTPRGRHWIAVAVGAATSVVATIGILQVLLDVRAGSLALVSDRPGSIVTNPVYFGALSALGVVLGVERISGGRHNGWHVSVLVCGVAVSLSGSRVAWVSVIATIVVLLAVRRTVRTAGAVVSGVVSLSIGVAVDRWVGAGRNAADRLSEGNAGGRLDAWRYGLEAAADRPIFGYGFGRFRPAVQRRFEPEFVRDHAYDDLGQAWFDAHNAVVGVLVAVGVVGLCLFAAWVISSLTEARGSLLWCLVPLAAHWMLQPISLYTLPLAAVLFGASMPAVRARSAQRAIEPDQPGGQSAAEVGSVVLPSLTTVRILVLAGLLFGLLVVMADVALRRAADRVDSGTAAVMGEIYFGDPVVSNVVAQIAAADPNVEERSVILEWKERSARTEPDRPYWWTQLAEEQIASERFDAARISLDRALDLQPYNIEALRRLAILALRTDDLALLEFALDALCEVGQPECEFDAAVLLG